MDRKFEANWHGSYVTPVTEIVEMEFFAESNGYDAKDIRRIAVLEVSQSVSFDRGDHIVTRVQ